ncbi:aspartyl-phosphate phosphatase Spo0E family protein [Bacillus sp. AK128]
METETAISRRIEDSRKELFDLASKSALSSPEVLKASISLDQLLNKYENFKNIKNSNH